MPVNIRFIEYMPFRGNQWDADGVVGYDEIRSRIESRFALQPAADNHRNHRIAENFSIPGHRGRVSIIASMSRSFCESCTRLRLTADGSLKACLFYPAQVCLRDPLRAGLSDFEIVSLIRAGVAAKPAGHPDPAALAGTSDLSMVEIGG
jgi:cyclic pyranopterin phosphate synthase